MTGISQIFQVPYSLVKDCYYIVDQTRPSEAAALYNSLKKDIEVRNHIMFVFNGAYAPLGFIKGFLRDSINGRVSIIDYLFVDKKYHHSGIGTLLLQTYENYCLENGVQDFSLYSAPTLQARNFYQKNGYSLVNPNYLMVKSLSR